MSNVCKIKIKNYIENIKYSYHFALFKCQNIVQNVFQQLRKYFQSSLKMHFGSVQFFFKYNLDSINILK